MGLPKEILSDPSSNFFVKDILGGFRNTMYHEIVDVHVSFSAQRISRMVELHSRSKGYGLGRSYVKTSDIGTGYYLPLIFAFWEAAQSCTGFSPLKLLYSCQPLRVVKLIKEGWEEQKALAWSLVKHSLQLRKQLKTVGAIARENPQEA